MTQPVQPASLPSRRRAGGRSKHRLQPSVACDADVCVVRTVHILHVAVELLTLAAHPSPAPGWQDGGSAGGGEWARTAGTAADNGHAGLKMGS
jgi:hypothetical protein